MAARKDGDPFDAALAARVKEAVNDVVRLQDENGVDVVNDGEYTKRSWQTYSRGRLERHRVPPAASQGETRGYGSITARESKLFPEFFAQGLAGFGRAALRDRAPAAPAPQGVFCVGPLTYIGQEEYKRDIEWIKERRAGPAGSNGARASRRWRRARSSTGCATSTTRRRKRCSSRSPTRCTRSTRRSRTPASSCSSTTRTCRTATTSTRT